MRALAEEPDRHELEETDEARHERFLNARETCDEMLEHLDAGGERRVPHNGWGDGLMNLADQFGRNLASCRRRGRLSQEELAVRASLHRTAVGQLERGERVCRVDTLIKLAGSLGIPPEELLEGLGWDPGGTRVGRFTEWGGG
jgi:DNA-binding XRE family transcriptional regulator